MADVRPIYRDPVTGAFKEVSNTDTVIGTAGNVFFQVGVTPTEPSGANSADYYLVYVINGDEITAYLWEPV